MLVLSRNLDEKIIINGNIVITVVRIQGDKVRLGVEAPKDITVHREEIQNVINCGYGVSGSTTLFQSEGVGSSPTSRLDCVYDSHPRTRRR